VPLTVLVAILIAAMWLIAFTSRWLRNWRVCIVLMLGTLLILGAGTLPKPFAALLQGSLWGGFCLLILTRGEDLSAVGKADYAFIEGYSGRMAEFAELKRGVLSSEPAAFVADYERAIEALEALEPPSADWADLKGDAIQELRRRLVIMKLGAQPSSETMDAANAAWSAIESRYELLVKEKTSFWAGLPRVTPG
jgi:hypothetical protein